MGERAADLAATGQKLSAIDKARKSKLLSDDKTQQMAEQTIESSNAAEPGSLQDALDGIGKVREMVGKGRLSEEQGKKLTDSITEGVGKTLRNGGGGAKDLVGSVTEKMKDSNLESADIESESSDGSKTRFKAKGVPQVQKAMFTPRPNKWPTARRKIVESALREERHWTNPDGSHIHESDRESGGGPLRRIDRLTSYYEATQPNLVLGRTPAWNALHAG